MIVENNELGLLDVSNINPVLDSLNSNNLLDPSGIINQDGSGISLSISDQNLLSATNFVENNLLSNTIASSVEFQNLTGGSTATLVDNLNGTANTPDNLLGDTENFVGNAIGSSAEFQNLINGDAEAPLSALTLQRQQIAQVIPRNPLCGPNDTEVVFFKDRLDNIGSLLGVGSGGGNLTPDQRAARIRDKIGEFFEVAVTRSLNVPRNTTVFPAPRRRLESATGTAPATSTPDAIADITYNERDNSGNILRSFTEPQSAIIEIKGIRPGNITLSNSDYEPEGYIQLAEQSPAAQNGLIPSIYYATTGGVTIRPDVISKVSVERIGIWQIPVFESCTNPGNIRTGAVGQSLNPSVYSATQITPQPIATGQFVDLVNLFNTNPNQFT